MQHMKKFAWCTDIHLDTVGNEKLFDKFANAVNAANPAGIFITGDISTAKSLVFHLTLLERVLFRPIYFVLGNHDYWGGRVQDVRRAMRDLSNMSQYLKYLPTTQYVNLDSSTALVGHDGWYDALNGDYKKSELMLNDWFKIGDYVDVNNGRKVTTRADLNIDGIAELSKKLAHEGVTHLHDSIKAAARYHKRIVVLTHVPPFEDSHVHNGSRGTPDAQPWYTSRMLGDMLLRAADAYPNITFDVYAGHTHGKYEGNFAKNLRVHVGAADYGNPTLQSLVEV